MDAKLKKKTWIGIGAVGACLLLIWMIHLMIGRGVLPDKTAYTIPRQIRYSFTLSNKTNQVIKNAEFWIYAPVKFTANQICDHIEASHPYKIIEDDMGNQVLHFTFETFPPFATRIVTIKVDLLMSEKANRIPEYQMTAFLKPETYIESDQADIKTAAGKLKESKSSKTAEKIFNWVAGHVEYAGYVKNDRGAYYAFSEKKGDCTEYMYLFTAMCRADTIPSRCIGGYVCSQNTVVKPAAYHNWSEFYDNGVWNIADPQKKRFMANTADYVAMRVIRPSQDESAMQFNRFRFKGDGLKVKMN